MKVICNKASECKMNCEHKKSHKLNKECGKCAYQDEVCIPVEPETKQTVIEVKACENCKFFYWDSDRDSCCNYYSKQLSWNLAKPDYCKITKIIVEEK